MKKKTIIAITSNEELFNQLIEKFKRYNHGKYLYQRFDAFSIDDFVEYSIINNPIAIVVDTDKNVDDKKTETICKYQNSSLLYFLIDYKRIQTYKFLFSNTNIQLVSKPIDIDALVTTVCGNLKTKANESDNYFSPKHLQDMIGEYIPTLRQHYLNMILKNGVLKKENVLQKFQLYNIDCSGPIYQVLIAKIENNENVDNFEATTLLLLNSIKACIKSKGLQCYIFFDSDFRIVSLIGSDSFSLFSEIEEIMYNVEEQFNNIKNITFYSGIGTIVKEIQEINNSYSEANISIEKAQREHKSVVFYQNIKDKEVNYLVEDAIEYIKKEYSNKNLGLETISEYVGLSSTYFCKLFHDETGKTFNAYVKEVRIENSKKLLEDESNKLQDIALRCGFVDYKYFTTVFKQITNLTPNEYRKSLKN